MIFNRCKWCKYFVRLKIIGNYETYKDTNCCIYNALTETNDSYVIETRERFTCKHFSEKKRIKVTKYINGKKYEQ